MVVLTLLIFSVSFVSIPLVAFMVYYRVLYKAAAAQLAKEKEITTNPNVIRLTHRCPDCEELDQIINMKPGTEKQMAILECFSSRKRR